MPLDHRAYLADIVESCDAIQDATRGFDLQSYQEKSSRSFFSRAGVHYYRRGRGDAARIAPAVFSATTRARRIVDFRNQLTHQYRTVDDALVWAIVETDVPVLRRECDELIGPAHIQG